MAKIPDKIFVVSQNRSERSYPIKGDWNTYDDESHNFGFLHPHEPNKASDAARKETQMQWAYTGTAYKNGSEWWERGSTFTYDSVTRQRNEIKFDRPIELDYAPRVWDNVPLSGFKLVDTVNRYRGNKLFKILDPRGVEFEITVQSLYHILCGGTVKQGLILDECIWQTGKNLILAKDK